ncbi:Vps13c [Symbiodinium natans]|uniref:Vps13c protein n=1 Tax=Symbiodinium natans TaxID=878477 RepID=A0A812V7R1_9DINO|nr:Vps13c [Symbiodinium natans]
MYKVVRIEGFAVQLYQPGETKTATYVLSPTGASLNLAHLPREQRICLELDLGLPSKPSEVQLLRSQVKQLMQAGEALAAEDARLKALLIPAELGEAAGLMEEALKVEYGQLFLRRLLHEQGIALADEPALDEDELRRLRLLEDALPVEPLAAQRLAAAELAEKRRQRREPGFLSIFFGQMCCAAAPGVRVGVEDLQDATEFESVEAPQNILAEVHFGDLAVRLVDDSKEDQEDAELLRLFVHSTALTATVATGLDYRGKSSANLKVAGRLGGVEATHLNQDVIKILDAGAEGAGAAKFALENKLEETCNVLSVLFHTAPLEVFFIPSMVPKLLDFVAPPPAAAAAEPSPKVAKTPKTPMSGVGSPKSILGQEASPKMQGAVQQLLGKEGDVGQYADAAYDRVPDQVHFDVRLASPKIHLPVRDIGKVVVNLGSLTLLTPEVCSMKAVRLGVALEDTMLMVATKREEFNVISPLPIDIQLNHKEDDDALKAEVKLTTGDLILTAAPQAVSVLAALPDVFAELAPPSQEAAAEKLQEVVEEAADAAQGQGAGALASSVGQSEAMQAATKRAKELTEKRLQLDVTAQLGKLEVAVLDMLHPVVTLQCQVMGPGIQLCHDSLLTGQDMSTSVKLDNLALKAFAKCPRSHEWEPLLEPFHIGASVQLQSMSKTSSALATKVSVSAHKPLLLNVAAPSLSRLAQLGPVYAASIERKSDTGSSRYSVVNLFGQPMVLEFHCPSGLVCKEIPPTGEKVCLEDEIFLHRASEVAVRLKEGASTESSRPLSIECTETALVPGSFCVAEMRAPEPGARMLLLASPLRLHNTCDVPLQLSFPGQKAKPTGTFTCQASVLGHQAPSYRVESHLPASGEHQDRVVAIMPNEIFAVPEPLLRQEAGHVAATVRGRFGLGDDFEWSHPFELSSKSILNSSELEDFILSCAKSKGSELPTLLAARPQAHDLKDSPVPKPRFRNLRTDMLLEDAIAPTKTQKKSAPCCGGAPKVSEPEEAAPEEEDAAHMSGRFWQSGKLHDLGNVTMLVLRPMLSLLNALPEASLSVAYRTRSKAMIRTGVLRDMTEWQEVTIPSMACVNIYDLSLNALTAGAEVKSRLGDSSVAWSSPVVLRPAALRYEAEMLEMDVRQTASGAACGLVAQPMGDGRLRISCPRIFTHRLDLGLDEVEVLYRGERLPSMAGLTMLPHNCETKKCEVVVKRPGAEAVKNSLVIPASFDTVDWKTPSGTEYYCVQCEDMASSGLMGASCKVAVLRPRLVVTNDSDHDMELLSPDGHVVILAAKESRPSHWHVPVNAKGAPELKLRPAGGAGKIGWSPAIPCCEQAAGSSSMLLTATEETALPLVWTASLAPSSGAFAIVLKSGSTCRAVNRASKAEMTVAPGDAKANTVPTSVRGGKGEVPIGWVNPFVKEKASLRVCVDGEEIVIKDVGRKAEIQLKAQKLKLSVSRVGENTVVALDEMFSLGVIERAASEPSVGSKEESVLEVALELGQIGVSLVDDLPHARELIFLHIGDINVKYVQNIDADSEQLRFVVGEIQGICQLPDRMDGSMLTKKHQHKAGVLRQEQPAVILANHGDKGTHFLDIQITREATSSQDLVLPKAEVLMDKLDVTVDNDWLAPLLSWLQRAIPQEAIDVGLQWDEVKARAGRAIVAEGYTPPAVPAIVSVEKLKLSEINLTVWCRLPVSSLDFLPAPVRAVLRVVSVGSNFTLNGAGIRLPEKQLPSYRGAVEDYAIKIGLEYASSLMQIVLSLLGKSSLLNGGAIPLAMGGTAVSMVTDGVGTTIRGGAGMLQHLAMDEGYVQQQQIHQEMKEINGAVDGLKEAGKSLATGMEGALDIFRKPVEGAKEEGVRGFAKGVGTGIAGTVIKPIVGVGQATSDIITGISAVATMDSTAKRRRRERCRRRGPRMLFGKYGTMRSWSHTHSEISQQLGTIAEGIQEIIPLASDGFHASVLLLYSDKLLLTKVKLHPLNAASRQGSDLSCDKAFTHTDAGPDDRSNRHRLRRIDREFPELLAPLEEVLTRAQTSVDVLTECPPGVSEMARGLSFAEMQTAELDENGELVLTDSSGNRFELPLRMEPEIKEALVQGLQGACGGRGDWTRLGASWRPEEQVHEASIRPKQKGNELLHLEV